MTARALLGYPVVWVFAALIHVVDADVGGIAGLYAPNVLLSVTVVALILFLPVFLPLAAFRRWGVSGYVVALLGIAGALASLVALAGSTATTATGWLVSIGGTMLICTVTYTVASLPGLVSVRPPRPAPAILLLVLLAVSSAPATAVEFSIDSSLPGGGDCAVFGDWDAANATCVVQDGILSFGDRLELFSGTLLIDGAMTTHGMIHSHGSVIVLGTLTNTSFILNDLGATLVVQGAYVGGGLYNFGGSFVISPSGSAEFNGFTDNSGELINRGYASIGAFFAVNFDRRTENSGSLEIAPTGEVSNSGLWINAGHLDNQGSVHNHVSVIELCDSVWSGNAATGEPATGALTIRLTAETLTWCAVPEAQRYDVVGGELGQLVAGGGDFTNATTTCLADSISALSVPVASTLSPGVGQWFLVRAEGSPSGGYDTVFTSQVEEREAEIDAAAAACP